MPEEKNLNTRHNYHHVPGDAQLHLSVWNLSGAGTQEKGPNTRHNGLANRPHSGKTCSHFQFLDGFKGMYIDVLKGGPVLLSNSHAGTGRNFTQPRAHLLVKLCML